MGENFDGLLSHIGTGNWNVFHYVLFGYWFSCVSYQTIGSVFLVPNVGHTCISPEHAFPAKNNALGLNDSGQEDKQSDSCTYLVQNITTGLLEKHKCYRWSYDNTTYSSTATSEFDLVCDWEYVRATYQSIYMLGVFVGAGVNGFMADRYGRRKLTVLGTVLYTVIAIILPWLPSIPSLLGARFLLGTMHSTSLITAYVLLMEVTEPQRRVPIGMFIFITWSFGTTILAGMGYLIREWRMLQLVMSLPTIIFLPGLWFIDESPRWLAINGRYDEALKILQKAARWNKVDLPPKDNVLTLMRSLQKELGSQEKKGDTSLILTKVKHSLSEILILLRTKKLRLITLSMYVDFFVVAMVYFGLSLGAGSFKVSPFLYLAITGLVEVPSHTLIIPIVIRFGCKHSLIIFYFLTGFTMLVQPLIDAYTWLSITLIMIGKMCISTVFQILGLYSTELFPTEVRNRGLGSSMMISRIGAMVSPYLMEILGVSYPWTPPVVFGLSSIVAGLASLPLQETRGTVLPETIADLEGYTNQAMESDTHL